MKKLDEKGFVFLDANKKPYWVAIRCGNPMLAYWNNDGWVNLRQINQTQIWQYYQYVISEEEAEIYHKKYLANHCL